MVDEVNEVNNMSYYLSFNAKEEVYAESQPIFPPSYHYRKHLHRRQVPFLNIVL